MTVGKLSIWYSGGYGLKYGLKYFLRYGIKFWLQTKKFGIFNPDDCNDMIKWGFIFMNIVVIRWTHRRTG